MCSWAQGKLTLTGVNTHAAGTTISGGTLQIDDGSGSGSIVGNVANNGTLIFNRPDAPFVFGGVISGTGKVVQWGGNYYGYLNNGTLVLTGSNTYTGGTTVDCGSMLQIDQGGTTGSIVGNVCLLNSSTLAFSRSDNIVSAGKLRTMAREAWSRWARGI